MLIEQALLVPHASTEPAQPTAVAKSEITNVVFAEEPIREGLVTKLCDILDDRPALTELLNKLLTRSVTKINVAEEENPISGLTLEAKVFQQSSRLILTAPAKKAAAKRVLVD